MFFLNYLQGCAILFPMKDADKSYLVNCGEWYSLEKAMSPEDAAQRAMGDIFENKNLNISTTTLILEVDKCFRNFDFASSITILNTTSVLEKAGHKDRAESLNLIHRHLYQSSST